MIAPPALKPFTLRVPVIASVPRTQMPEVPEGLAYGTMLGPDVPQLAPRSPVLRFEGCNYWAFDLRDGREAMAIVAYTARGVLRQRWVREGARALWDITADPVTRTVTFHGQRRNATREPGTITMSWDELVPLQPIVSRRPKAQLPAVAPDLMYSVPGGPDSPEEQAICPVLRFGDHTYWPLSFRDRRLTTGLVAYDACGREVRRWERDGARSIWQITCDPAAQTVTFHGQRLSSTRQPGTVTLSWDELWIG
jgi:hypothetical protein